MIAWIDILYIPIQAGTHNNGDRSTPSCLFVRASDGVSNGLTCSNTCYGCSSVIPIDEHVIFSSTFILAEESPLSDIAG